MDNLNYTNHIDYLETFKMNKTMEKNAYLNNLIEM